MIEFGPFAVKRDKDRGEKKAKSFDFLGFTHYCSRAGDGRRFRTRGKTTSKRFSAKLRVYKEWINSNRTLTTPEIMLKTAAKLQGHYGYYGATDNARKIGAYYNKVKRNLFNWLNRRGKRGSYNWENFNRLLERYPLPVPRIKVSMF